MEAAAGCGYSGRMDGFDAVVRGRHSTRAFDPKRSVPADVLRECLELAARAPSNCNAQPWRVFIAGGKRCASLRERLYATAAAGTPPEQQTTPDFVGVYRQRQVACAVELYQKTGVARHDKDARLRASLRNFLFFDAPHVAVLCMDKSFGVGVALDVGAYLQTLLLALHSRGVSSCAQASIRTYASIVADELQIPEDLMVLCGVAFGYELTGAGANEVRQDRSPVQENVTWLGFDAD